MATQNISGKIKLRNDTAQNWEVENPVLLAGEMGLETDTGNCKFGDGQTTWNSLKYAFRRNNARNIEYIVGTQTAKTGAFKGVTEDTSLYDGKCINYYLPYAGNGNATLELTFPNGSTSGAKPIYIVNSTRLTTHYGEGTIFQMTYSVTKDAWYCGNYWYDSNTQGQYMYYYNTAYFRSAIVAESLAVGDSTGYIQATSGASFDISYPILWITSNIAAGGTNYASCFIQHYDRNLNKVKPAFSGTKWKMVYLVVTISGATATIDSEIITQNVPTTEDGKVYIALGRLGNQTTGQNFFLFQQMHPMFYYKDGAFRPYDATTASAGTSNGKVKINGTDVTVYTHPTTEGNKHIPSGGATGKVLAYGGSSGTASWGDVPSHNQASNTINAMTGYSKPSSTSAIGTSDTLNAAIGKLEKALDGKQAAGSYAAADHNHDGRYIYWGGNASNNTAWSWGTLTVANGYTQHSHLTGSSGCEGGFASKGGQLNMQLDGFFYQNEGRYRCLDTSDSSSFAAASHSHNYAGSSSAGGAANSLVNFTAGLNGVAEHNANNIATNGVWYYTSNGPAKSLGASTDDGALYSQAYSTAWVGQIAQDYRNGRLFVRGKNNNTWQAWQRIPWYSEVALSSHNQASNTINAMTGYSKPSTTSAITASDSLNTAIGKLEKALEPDVSLSINDPGGSSVWIEVPVEHLIVGSTTPTDHNAIWIEIIS